MIRRHLLGAPGRRRPFVTAHIALPSLDVAGDAQFLVDTGADSSLLSPIDALFLAIDISRLPQGAPGIGIGGMTTTVEAQATITLGTSPFPFALRVLAPRTRRQAQAVRRIPSLLGRDILAHFALFLEERTDRVLLLEPDEADALQLP